MYHYVSSFSSLSHEQWRAAQNNKKERNKIIIYKTSGWASESEINETFGMFDKSRNNSTAWHPCLYSCYIWEVNPKVREILSFGKGKCCDREKLN